MLEAAVDRSSPRIEKRPFHHSTLDMFVGRESGIVVDAAASAVAKLSWGDLQSVKERPKLEAGAANFFEVCSSLSLSLSLSAAYSLSFSLSFFSPLFCLPFLMACHGAHMHEEKKGRRRLQKLVPMGLLLFRT